MIAYRDDLERAKQKVRKLWERYVTVDEENEAWEALRKASGAIRPVSGRSKL